MADHAAEATNSGLVLSDGAYNALRQIVEKVFPGLGVLYTALATLWGWSHVTEVVGTLAALAIFGGVLLSLARRGYSPASTSDTPPGGYDGKVVSDVNEAGDTVLRLQLDSSSAESILTKRQVVFKGYDPTA
jgi:hypothetical protein